MESKYSFGRFCIRVKLLENNESNQSFMLRVYADTSAEMITNPSLDVFFSVMKLTIMSISVYNTKRIESERFLDDEFGHEDVTW